MGCRSRFVQPFLWIGTKFFQTSGAAKEVCLSRVIEFVFRGRGINIHATNRIFDCRQAGRTRHPQRHKSRNRIRRFIQILGRCRLKFLSAGLATEVVSFPIMSNAVRSRRRITVIPQTGSITPLARFCHGPFYRNPARKAGKDILDGSRMSCDSDVVSW